MNRHVTIFCALLAVASISTSVWILRAKHADPRAPGPSRSDLAAFTQPWSHTNDTLESCSSDDVACIAQAWSNRAYETNASRVLGELGQAAAQDPTVAARCHTITHKIGAATFARLDGDVGRAIAEGSAVCQGGYVHGVMQELVRTDHRPLSAVVADACTLGPGTTNSVRNDCLHGLGHGITIHLGWELPTAIKACDALEDSDRLACTGGVFMESFTPSVPGLVTRWNTVHDDPNVQCSKLRERDRSECHYAIGQLDMRATGNDFRAFAARCAEVDRRWRDRCAEALGANAASFTQRDVPRVVAACRAPNLDVSACILGASRSTASWRGRPQDAVTLCRAAGDDVAAACWEGIGNITRMVTTSEAEARARCTTVAQSMHDAPARARTWCIEGRAVAPNAGADHAMA